MYFKPVLGISLVLIMGSMGLEMKRARAGDTPDQIASIEQLTKEWPAKPKDMARVLVEKYGMPDEVTSKTLICDNKGPWKRTILRREEVVHNMPKPHTDFLEQVISYRVPTESFSDLVAFDGSLVIRRTDGELAVICDKEENNILALNVALDVIQKNRSVEDARRFLAQNIAELAAGGKPEYAQELKIPAQSIIDARDPDVIVAPE